MSSPIDPAPAIADASLSILNLIDGGASLEELYEAVFLLSLHILPEAIGLEVWRHNPQKPRAQCVLSRSEGDFLTLGQMQGDSQPVLLTKVRPIAEALKLDKSKEGSTEAWGLQPGRYVASIPLHARLSPAGKNEVVGLLLVYSEVRVAKLVAVEFLAKLCSLGIEYSLLRTPNVLPSERYQDALTDFNRMKEKVRRLKANPADIQKRQWDEAYQQWLQDLVGSLERHLTDSIDM